MSEDLLAVAVGRMRQVSAPEAPFSGWLARTDDDVVQLVDVADLRGWPGWRARGDHVLSVQDVARTAQGHEAVIPWCVERVVAFVGRRSAAGVELSAGEIVTITVSLMRGCEAARDADLTGAWWLTHDGTPVFVSDPSGRGERIGDAAAGVIEGLAGSRAVDHTWRLPQIAAMIREARSVRDLEAQLFAIVTPEPLVLTPLAPRRAADARRSGVVAELEPEGDSVFGRLLRRHVDSGVGEMVSDALGGVRRAARGARRRVAKPWLVAAGIAGVIVIGGMAWPTGSAPPASARSAASESPASDPTEDPAPDPGARSTDGPDESERAAKQDDPVAALRTALDLLATCGGGACDPTIFEDPSAPDPPPGSVDLAAAERTVQLLDDLGGVAILSVTPTVAAIPSQIVVLVRVDDRWLIRSVQDVEEP